MHFCRHIFTEVINFSCWLLAINNIWMSPDFLYTLFFYPSILTTSVKIWWSRNPANSKPQIRRPLFDVELFLTVHRNPLSQPLIKYYSSWLHVSSYAGSKLPDFLSSFSNLVSQLVIFSCLVHSNVAGVFSKEYISIMRYGAKSTKSLRIRKPENATKIWHS